MPQTIIPTIDWDIPTVDFNKVYDLNVGEIFKYTKDIETLGMKIEANKPVTHTVFKVTTITPGTHLFTLYGGNHMIVSAKTVTP